MRPASRRTTSVELLYTIYKHTLNGSRTKNPRPRRYNLPLGWLVRLKAYICIPCIAKCLTTNQPTSCRDRGAHCFSCPTHHRRSSSIDTILCFTKSVALAWSGASSRVHAGRGGEAPTSFRERVGTINRDEPRFAMIAAGSYVVVGCCNLKTCERRNIHQVYV